MIQATDLRKHFDGKQGMITVLNGISIKVPEGELLTILGPSGCGKTTTLRCIAGLERPESGKILIGERLVFCGETKRFEPPERRRIGMVFQSYAIWPHMTVYQNVSYALEGRKLSKPQMKAKVEHVLSLVGLAELAHRPAPNLSGGQQQRVALARAIVAEPRVLLLDEPLSNLDAKLREQMRTEIRQLQQNSGITAVYVTHDQEEALAVSDKIVVMLEGRIVDEGTPQAVYSTPRSRFVAEFLGDANFLAGKVIDRSPGSVLVETAGGKVICGSENWEVKGGIEEVTVFFRPENIIVTRESPGGQIGIAGIISRATFLGKTVECIIAVGEDQQVRVMLHPQFAPQIGEWIYLLPDADACSLIS